MFADLLVWDDADQGEVEEALVDVSQALDRVAALDGRSRTLVTVYGGDAHLAVGGDAVSGLVVYATFDNEVYHQVVVDLEVGDREVEIVAGGQPGRYAAKNVVSLEKAVLAAEAFARDGCLAAGLVWSER